MDLILPTELPDSPDTLGGYLLRAASETRPERGLRLLDRREQETLLSWPEVLERAQGAAGALAAAGVEPGDRVAIVLPTGTGFIDAFMGCQVLGAVPVPLYPPVRLGRLGEYHLKTAAMLEAAGCRLLVTEPRIHRLMGQTLVRYRPELGVLLDGALAGGALHEPVQRDPEDLCMVQFSSGTTVNPKPVALSHRAVLAQVHALMDQIRTGLKPGDRLQDELGVSWLPLYHDMGLIGGVFPAVIYPGPVVLIPPEVFLAKPAIWLRAISRYRGTISPAPNFAYALCTERIRPEDVEGLDLSCWDKALNGAEPVSVHVLEAFCERFAAQGFDPKAMMPVYGLSEAALAVTFSPPGRGWLARDYDADALSQGLARPAVEGLPAATLVSVGVAVAGFVVELRDEEGVVLPEGEVGTIWAKGPSLMSGYLDREDSPVVDGWLDTGDLGFLDGGELFITGRAKDLIILRGRNHAPHDIERAVDGVPGVRTGCSAAVAHLDSGEERLVLFVEARKLRDDLAEDCRKAVLATTGLNPQLVVVLDPGTLPRTSSGKIRRSEALRRFLAGELRPPEKVGAWMLAGAFASSAMGFLGRRR